jgi:hypothetical protein
VRRVIEDVEKAPRTFRSMGAGRGKTPGGRAQPPRWPSDELYRKAMGER